MAERVGDFVIYCTPNQHAVEAQEFQEGPINLTNKAHDEYSVVTVVSEPNQKGFLLELASAMTGLGVTIHEAIIEVRPCSILHLNIDLALHMHSAHTCSSVEPSRHITLIMYCPSLHWHDLVTFMLTGLYMPLPVLCACCISAARKIGGRTCQCSHGKCSFKHVHGHPSTCMSTLQFIRCSVCNLLCESETLCA